MVQKETAVPGTIETLGFWFRHLAIVPSGTDSSLKTLTQHFVLGYFRQIPAGLIFLQTPTTCAILIAMTRMGGRRTATEDNLAIASKPGYLSSQSWEFSVPTPKYSAI